MMNAQGRVWERSAPEQRQRRSNLSPCGAIRGAGLQWGGRNERARKIIGKAETPQLIFRAGSEQTGEKPDIRL